MNFMKVCRELFQTLKTPTKLANLTFPGAILILDEMKRSLNAQKEGTMPGMASTGFEAHNICQIQKIIDQLKSESK